MSDNIFHLKAVTGGAHAADTEEGYVSRILSFLEENKILEDYSNDDVELDQPRGDETRLGKLTPLECKCFVASKLLEEVVRIEMLEIEAGHQVKIGELMRQHKITPPEAIQRLVQETSFDDDMLRFINAASLSRIALESVYMWSCRSRFNEWSHQLIVRTGFVVHSYG